VNVSTIQFSGAATCAVAVGDVVVEKPPIEIETDETTEPAASDPEPVASGEQPSESVSSDVAAAATTQPAAAEAPTAVAVVDEPQTLLRDLLVGPLLKELALAEADARIDFDPKATDVLELTSPQCGFQIDATRAADLGAVAWNVTLTDKSGAQRQVSIAATVRAWEDQVVLKRPLNRGQKVFAKDLSSRRVLVDERNPDAVADATEAAGQLATRDLKAGSPLTPADLAAPAIVAKGDFIQVSVPLGHGRQVETVARAMEAGAKGAVIRATNEATRDVYRVVVTGASAGDVIQEQETRAE
jgi:flagella basal body P-ring formation protein FlgA